MPILLVVGFGMTDGRTAKAKARARTKIAAVLRSSFHFTSQFYYLSTFLL
jgi:hypothetical protein